MPASYANTCYANILCQQKHHGHPDALSRDTMAKDLALCARCFKTVDSVEVELTQVDVLRCADLMCAKSDGGAVEGIWRRERYGGGIWQVSGGRRRPVVPGLHEDGYPDRRAKNITKCEAKAGAREQDCGALGFL
jgi:hypothetical protein